MKLDDGYLSKDTPFSDFEKSDIGRIEFHSKREFLSGNYYTPSVRFTTERPRVWISIRHEVEKITSVIFY